MQPKSSGVANAPHLDLPKDLLVAAQSHGAPRRHDFSVEGWKPSLFERFIEKLTGRK